MESLFYLGLEQMGSLSTVSYLLSTTSFSKHGLKQKECWHGSILGCL